MNERGPQFPSWTRRGSEPTVCLAAQMTSQLPGCLQARRGATVVGRRVVRVLPHRGSAGPLLLTTAHPPQHHQSSRAEGPT